MEIERKFLIEKFPEGLPLVEQAIVKQSYLSTNPELRIRQITTGQDQDKYLLTIKSDGLLARSEVNLDLSESQYQELIQNVTAEPIVKDYRVYLLPDNRLLECSLVDDDKLSRFMYAEVEFSSIQEANIFKKPDCLGAEVTFSPLYKMKNYWKNNR